jgi:hypothetical protein
MLAMAPILDAPEIGESFQALKYMFGAMKEIQINHYEPLEAH